MFTTTSNGTTEQTTNPFGNGFGFNPDPDPLAGTIMTVSDIVTSTKRSFLTGRVSTMFVERVITITDTSVDIDIHVEYSDSQIRLVMDITDQIESLLHCPCHPFILATLMRELHDGPSYIAAPYVFSRQGFMTSRHTHTVTVIPDPEIFTIGFDADITDLAPEQIAALVETGTPYAPNASSETTTPASGWKSFWKTQVTAVKAWFATIADRLVAAGEEEMAFMRSNPEAYAFMNATRRGANMM
jgi:hypothetical protein